MLKEATLRDFRERCRSAHGSVEEDKMEARGGLLAYCAIGISIALIAITFGIHQAKTNQSPGLGTKWVGFSFMTLLVFVNVFRSRRSYWGVRAFWKAMIPISILHVGVGVVILAHLGIVALINFVVAGLVEYFALTALLDEFLIRKQRD